MCGYNEFQWDKKSREIEAKPGNRIKARELSNLEKVWKTRKPDKPLSLMWVGEKVQVVGKCGGI